LYAASMKARIGKSLWDMFRGTGPAGIPWLRDGLMVATSNEGNGPLACRICPCV